ncbi:MAG: KTSC domain-containing protein [Anaerolineaceae bacterium]|nr:KTSC domain-containing protein [Anaerolineaceae bacterium]
MNRDYVESSMIRSMGYDSATGTVEIEFVSDGQVWQYCDVPEITYNEVRFASSIGSAFHRLIRNQFRAVRIN